MRECVEQMRIDLSGAVVLTEAATGPYVVTPVLAALAGAREVIGVTRESRYGTVEEVRRATLGLAALAGVADRVLVSDRPATDYASRADVVTNSGHLRPIGPEMVERMRPTTVVPLMFEAWEIQAGRFDVDLPALRTRGIAFSGTNERHPTIDVFSHLGTMAVRLLTDSATAVHGATVLVLCDNPFGPYLEAGLSGAGAGVRLAAGWDSAPRDVRPDAVLVALRPRGGPVLSEDDLGALAHRWPGTLVAQFWGDLERTALDELGLRYWPLEAPGQGHMGVLPSAVGPEPVVRLQAGGLKVASVLLLPSERRTPFDEEFLDDL
ncbi:hypothetical protein H9L09_17015 [Nocardioides mesophilus]|uniref:Uncharacterized protein n=2 Tax=Nocardioides mesophilus TaxID=433659 RepID=A0A7G9RHP6_9ACTN|nr:hypothetical protein H9L09_17015 [Nocardioides mesophilus]